MPIRRECIERIKETADLYDIVSGYVQLKRSGVSWKGLSPFTVEKTPSFFVHPEKKFFKCFSTGYAGDVFRFLELKENFAFLEAVE
jgi:DNA primase